MHIHISTEDMETSDYFSLLIFSLYITMMIIIFIKKYILIILRPRFLFTLDVGLTLIAYIVISYHLLVLTFNSVVKLLTVRHEISKINTIF